MTLESGEHKGPEFLKLYPMGKLPVLVHEGVVITEAAAICMYLADTFPKCGLAPLIQDPARGPYYCWILFAASCFEYSCKRHMQLSPMK
jgi:glutathione S-transferase